MQKHRSYKGLFIPQNPGKYIGDASNIVYRSLWERKVMKFLDMNPNILQWASEEVVIPYISPVDGKPHRYFPDFYTKMKDKNGTIKEVILEVKPKIQTIEPKKKSKITKRYITEVMTYGINQAKWKYAKEYCRKRNWDFKVLTEDDIFAHK